MTTTTTQILLLGCFFSVVVSGCSSPVSRTTASGNFKYLKSQETPTLIIPDGLDTPDFFAEFRLPKAEGLSGPKGPALSVRSPQVVLPLVSGSHITEGSKQASVWFDKIDESRPLDETIWDTVLGYLEKNNIDVISFEPEQHRLITDWLISEYDEDTRWYEWSSSTREVGERFEFTLNLKAHGRSAELSVILKDYLETRGQQTSDTIDPIQRRREEVGLLNQVMGYYEYQLRLEDSRRITKIRQGVATEMGFNNDGESAFVVSERYDVVWPRLLLVLRKLGFDVKDIDKSAGLMFVHYSGDNSKWWSNLFTSKKELAKEGDYRLKIGKMGERTSITFMDNDSVAFSPKQIADMYDAFSSVMAEDNLDL